MASLYKLPGSRFAVRRAAEVPRAGVGAALLFGGFPALAKILPAQIPLLERTWARTARRLLGIRLNIEGLQHVDRSEQYVVAPLHEGLADIVALLHLPLDLRFAVRDEFIEWSVLGRHLNRSSHIAVDPDAPHTTYRRLLQRGPAVFSSRASLVMFPQGSILGIETAFRPGAFRLADRLSRPVLPVVLSGSHRVWEHPFSPVVRFGRRIDVTVLPPIAVGTATPAMRDLERRMKAMALRAEAPARRFLPERDGWWDGYSYEIDPDFGALAARVAAHRSANEHAGQPRSSGASS